VRPLSRRALWALAVLLGFSGAGMLLYPPITDIISNREQARLLDQFRSPEFRVRFATRDVLPGQVVMRITIPRIGVDTLVVEGTDPRALRAGAGRYLSTSLPCGRGNVGIAGHRTTYGGPFLRLDELRPGDSITLITPEETCSYEVVNGPPGTPRPRTGAAGWVTAPTDGGVIGPLPGSMLTLTTCHPKRSAAERLILRAKLVS
jgi:sortase A